MKERITMRLEAGKEPVDVYGLMKTTKQLRRLNHIRRFSSFPALRQENVSEHTFWVQVYALQIARSLEAKGMVIDKGKLVIKALLHDVEEHITGDIVRSFKYHNPALTAEIKRTEHEIAEPLVINMLGKELCELWKDSKDSSIEGRIVAFSDLWSVLAYCHEEVMLGNSYMVDVFMEALSYLGTADYAYFGDWMDGAKRMLLEIKEKIGKTWIER